MAHANTIKFNCTNFAERVSARPANCYNCRRRDGYPRNLGGDELCVNFKPRPKTSRKARKPGQE